MNKYQYPKEVILEFHEMFYVQSNKRLNNYSFLAVFSFLIVSFISFSFFFCIAYTVGYESLKKSGFEFIEYSTTLTLVKFFFIMLIASSACLAWYIFVKNKFLKEYYVNRFEESSDILENKNIEEIKKLSIRGLRILWIQNKFKPENIDSAIWSVDETYDYIDSIDRSLTSKGFFSNYFIKSLIAVLVTLGLNSALTVIISKTSVANLTSSDISNIVFSVSLILILVYFYYYFIKDITFDFFDLFISKEKITKLRRGRLSLFLHQAKLLKVEI